MTSVPAAVLEAWPALRDAEVTTLGNGLINQTYAVETRDGPRVLQRVNEIFGIAVHADIDAVTRRLQDRGVGTPVLVETGDGGRCADLGEQGVWRLMTRVQGTSFSRVATLAQARGAGQMLGRFHSALHDLDHEFQSVRVGVHDTPAHLAKLQSALREHAGHRLRKTVVPLADSLLAAAQSLPVVSGVPERVVHGDPKLDNILFADREPPGCNEPVCMVDLDTCGRMPLHLELGDAWRSWCNRAGEDGGEPGFDIAVYEASLSGYREHGPELHDAERGALVHGVEWITLELAARFLADALNESYFGWDAEQFASAGDHNLVRARGQWALHGATVACRAERSRLL